MFLQFRDLPKLASKSILDTCVWIVTFLATVILDVDFGLIVGVLVNVLIILYWGIFPNVDIVHETDFIDLQLDGKMYHDVSFSCCWKLTFNFVVC